MAGLLWATSASADYFYDEDAAAPGFSHFEERSELSDAQRLVKMLSTARKTEELSVFKDAQSAWYSTFAFVLRKYIDIELKRLPNAPQNVLLRRVLMALDVAQATNVVGNQLLQLQLATTPNRITAFYATAERATEFHSSSGRALAWKVDENDGGHLLQFYVGVHIPGSTAPILTPVGLADRIVNGVKINTNINWAVHELIRPWVRAAVKYAFDVAAQKLRSQSYLEYGFNPPPAWLNSNEQEVPIPAANVGPFAVGDSRVVKLLTPSAPASISFKLTDGNAYNPGTDLPSFLAVGLRYVVVAHKAGMAKFQAELRDEFKSIGRDVTYNTREMTFWVQAKQKSPNLAEPMPTWTGPNVPPVLPPPKPPDPIPPPRPAPPPKAPPVPVLPTPVICEQLPNGQWNDPAQCEPK